MGSTTFFSLVYYIIINWMINDNVVNGLINISFIESSFELSLPLFNHISSTFNNSLYIIGGYINNYSNPKPSNIVYCLQSSIILNKSNNNSIKINKIDSPYIFSFDGYYMGFGDPTSFVITDIIKMKINISCDYQCYSTINENIYILQYNSIDDIQYLIIYNMINNSYIKISNYTQNIRLVLNSLVSKTIQSIRIGCVVSDNEYIMVIAELINVQGGETTHILKYIPQTNIWELEDLDMSFARRYMGCGIYNEYLYLFGGEWIEDYYQVIELQHIEKCTYTSIDATNCTILTEFMQYPRSHFYVASML